MRLKRIMADTGLRIGAEDRDGGWRDVTGIAGDINAESLGGGILDRLRGADLSSCAPLPEGRLLPCVGHVGKFMCIGLNYSDHAAEMDMAHPDHPILFLKANSAIAGAEDDLVMPRGSTRTDWEVELGVVIGRAAKYVTEADALTYVAGYCVANDISERDFQMTLSGQWTKGKSCDGFGPIGPWLVTADDVPDPQSLDLWVDVNGERMQSGNTARMIFPVAQIVSHLSGLMTIHPGDVIATGTPPGVGVGRKPQVFLKAGDVMETGIAGLGVQRQTVRAG